MECVSVVDGGWLFDKNLNEWTSMTILVYNYCDYFTYFYNLLDLLLSKDNCKEREFGTER